MTGSSVGLFTPISPQTPNWLCYEWHQVIGIFSSVNPMGSLSYMYSIADQNGMQRMTIQGTS